MGNGIFRPKIKGIQDTQTPLMGSQNLETSETVQGNQSKLTFDGEISHIGSTSNLSWYFTHMSSVKVNDFVNQSIRDSKGCNS